tara:strand:- start:1003 stop:1236 length:234 start_codon:yes stop_codon:yes gene_type:complete
VEQKLYRRIAEKREKSVSTVQNVIKSQFEFVGKAMKSKELPSIKLDYLGRFEVKRARKKHVDKLKAKYGTRFIQGGR